MYPNCNKSSDCSLRSRPRGGVALAMTAAAALALTSALTTNAAGEVPTSIKLNARQSTEPQGTESIVVTDHAAPPVSSPIALSAVEPERASVLSSPPAQPPQAAIRILPTRLPMDASTDLNPKHSVAQQVQRTRESAAFPENYQPLYPQRSAQDVGHRLPRITSSSSDDPSPVALAADNWMPVAFALQEPAEPADSPPQDEAAGNGDGGLADDDTRLGQEPQTNELVFLRRQTVMLAAGESQFDIGFSYSHLDDDRPLALLNNNVVVGVVEARTRQRLLVMPLEVRYGLTDRIQLFANAPFGWANAEIATNNFAATQDVGGIGDTRAGASFLVRQGQGGSPDVVFTLGVTAPTGNDTFLATNLVPNSQLGEGFWSTFVNVLFIHTFDPVVVFYGAGYNHRFDDQFLGVNVNPGEEFNYQLGVGFAVNSNVSLSASFQGAYLSELRVADDLIEGSTLEPMRMRFAVTVLNCGRIWEPFAEIPMTDDAAARVGMTWTY